MLQCASNTKAKAAGAYLGEKVVNENEYRSAMVSICAETYLTGAPGLDRSFENWTEVCDLRWAER